ncbi:hypothetical protein GIB67_017386 [Kingdonia uniflora]|uniref:Uncharacterized protein n=1 Tax=Kingdonia uniflora TaxID=39325 RepID=A0A7J7M454_9MAGN|nr:hypothetical protein GIB67_017386 [Kingdonia uniflora]
MKERKTLIYNLNRSLWGKSWFMKPMRESNLKRGSHYSNFEIFCVSFKSIVLLISKHHLEVGADHLLMHIVYPCRFRQGHVSN